MLKKWSRVALLAAATAFVLAAFGACMNGSEDSSGDSGSRVVAQYESQYGELTFYSDGTFEFEFEDMSKAAAVARASRRTITGTYTGDPVTGTGLSLTANDGTTISAVFKENGKILQVTVDLVSYDLTKKSVSSGNTSSSASTKLPAPVGTNPLTEGASYTAEGDGELGGWAMCFYASVPFNRMWGLDDEEGEVGVQPSYVTVEGSTLVEKRESPTVLNYSYDSDKRELYVQLSKFYINTDDKDYYGGKEAYVDSVLADWASVGQDDYWKGQEDKLDELADIIFSQVHTYGYEKDEAGVIKLTLKSEMTCMYDIGKEYATHVTLTPEKK